MPNASPHHSKPIIGVTVDVVEVRYEVARTYAEAILTAGGTPVLLVPDARLVERYLDLCDGFVFTGGDDPRTEPFGVPTHPKAKPIEPTRQAFETELLRCLDHRPALGVCLGMQMMALVAGGELDQHLPDTLLTHEQHWDRRHHAIEGEIGNGEIHSHHHQAVRDPGSLKVIGHAPDGVIEAIRDPDRPFFVGVQWHPERSGAGPLGLDLFAALVETCRERRHAVGH